MGEGFYISERETTVNIIGRKDTTQVTKIFVCLLIQFYKISEFILIYLTVGDFFSF